MEVTLSDDQEFFRDTTRKFLESECPITKVRDLAGSDAGFERDYWRQGAELGWTSLLVPEDLGGGSISGSGVVDLTLVADVFGATVAPGPLLPTNVVAAALARSGTDEQKAGVLPAIIAGEVVATWAVAEPAPNDRLGDVTVSATADGDGFVLSGVKAPVEAGAQSEQLLVTARTDDGLAQFLVPADAAGVTITPLQSLDLVRRYARRRARRGSRAGDVRRRRAGTGRRRRRAPAPARDRDPNRRERRRGADGVRLHARVDVQPLLVRSSACVVPEPQASVRRHEDVARGEPRDRSGRARARCRRKRPAWKRP